MNQAQTTHTPTHTNLTRLDDRDVEAFIAGHPLTVVYANAPWCSLCRILGPQIDALAAEHAGHIRFGSIDVDQAPEYAARNTIMALPTLLLYRNGQPTARIVGLVPRDHLRSELDTLAS